MSDRLTALRAMTPAEVWARYVGTQHVGDLDDYLDWAMPDEDYTQDERRLVAAKLEAHRATGD